METDGGRLRFKGYAAYRHAPPPPEVQRRRAVGAADQADALLVSGGADSEKAARRAIELLVDAFLLDRVGNADSFARAHQLGAEVERRFGCRYSHEADGWVNECGVLALHSRWGQSVGGVIHTACSICGAAQFGCLHVEGETFQGQRCRHVVQRWDVEEVSLTPRPHDPRCYRQAYVFTDDDVEEQLGHRLRSGEVPTCEHCRSCYGRNGPTTDDLDPASFPDLPVDEEPTRRLAEPR
jgi:hypothetical protein